ncbi:tetratricopeptide repeat protein [Brevibacillus laterosporus]|uniref:tetratricopeptide repeat protein n=1 Tax=Brevibacillus laterosporus TaxID=1465 RepID=UPI0003B222C3|nr:tetratricopeptide repeat protein [Brevibacillus laterosporus]ERM20135.1 Tfp pilus assembly protein PilF [Brevibacillus laterosporus PE36]
MPKKWLRIIEEAVNKIENDEMELGLQVLHKIGEHGKEIPEVMFCLADVWYGLGHNQEAIKIIRDLLANPAIPKEMDQEAKIMAAEIALDEADYDAAHEYLYALKEEGYEEIQLYLLLADLYAIQDLEEVAVKYLKIAHERDPDNEELRAALSEMYMKTGEVQEAINLLDEISETTFHALVLKARTFAQQGQFEEAYQLYTKAVQYEQLPEVVYGCALMSFYTDKWEEAERYIQLLIAIDEEYVIAYPLHSDILLSQGKTEAAIDALKKYVDLSGFDVEHIRRLTALLMQAGRYEESKEYQKLLEQWDLQEETNEE